MPDFEFYGGGNRIGVLRTEPTSLTALGGPACPTLRLVAHATVRRLDYQRATGDTGKKIIQPVSIIRASAQLDVGSVQGLAYSVPTDLAIGTRNLPEPQGGQLELRFVLTALQIAELEALRRGGVMTLTFRIRLQLALHAPCEEAQLDPQRGWLPYTENAVVKYDLADVQVTHAVPKSEWAENVLPALGLGKRHLVEIELPQPPNDVRFDRARSHLEAAWSSFARGDDRAAMMRCLNVWEAVMVAFVSPSATVQRDTFGELLRAAEVPSGKLERLKTLLYELAAFNNVGRHDRDPAPTPIDHRDAEFALLVTHSAMGYLARLGVFDKAPETQA